MIDEYVVVNLIFLVQYLGFVVEFFLVLELFLVVEEGLDSKAL
jgi:hypothetical protein